MAGWFTRQNNREGLLSADAVSNFPAGSKWLNVRITGQHFGFTLADN